MKTYIIFRKEGFYPIDLDNDKQAKANAEANPGTIRVEDLHGKVIWKNKLKIVNK